ncbi:MAG: hypothetical protein Kow0029_22250 [Candidatus Rifleibacteriota bacterium]
MITFDCLFAINQDCPLEKLVELINSKRMRRVLILSSHYLFEFERNYLAERVNASIVYKIFNDFISDTEMEECDRKATGYLKNKSGNFVKDRYLEFFVTYSLYYKNRVVWQKIKDTFRVKKICYSAGLGISEELWSEIGSDCIFQVKGRINLKRSRFSWLKSMFSPRKMLEKNEVNIIERKDSVYFLFCPIKRLSLKPDIKIKTLSFLPINHIRPCKLSWEHCIENFIKANSVEGKKSFFCSTIHGYERVFSRVKMQQIVFIDGHHPSNYPRSYLDYYPGGIFAGKDLISLKWFAINGRETNFSYDFLEAPYFSEKVTSKNVKKVYLFLNHAGDWTSLINRSDTDILVHAFAGTALKNPELQFIIRPHPTMDHPLHEGTNSSKRLRKFIETLALGNLSVSGKSFEEDMADADLVVSEYSKTLIDAFACGKLALICNLTGRRSFMSDYERFGFPCSNSVSSLENAIRNAAKHPDSLAKVIMNASIAYNSWLRKHLKE